MRMKYRKKPVVVEAFQMTRAVAFNSDSWPMWLQNAWYKKRGDVGSLYSCVEDGICFRIVTLEGDHNVNWNDYIIRGVEGELYPCKPGIFHKTYEAIE